MKNKFSKFINLQGKYLTSLLIVLLFGIGQMWGTDITWTCPSSTDAIVYQQTMSDGQSKFHNKNSATSTSTTTPEKKTDDVYGMKTTNSGGLWIIPNVAISKVTITYLCGSTNSSDISYKVQSSNYGNNLTSASTVAFAVKAQANKNVWYDAEITVDVSKDAYLYIKFPTNVYISYVVLTPAPSGYSVTYEENGHGANQTDLTNQTALPNPLPTLSESGWTFGGWFLDNNTFNTAATAGATISQNTTLYAKWTQESVAEVCPSGLTISGTKDYTEGQTIELTAGLSAGNGTIVYQWYKGSIAAGNEVGTGASFSKTNCATSDAGNYYCVASKDGCSDAESTAYAVAVAEVTKYTVTLNPAGGTIADANGWTLNGGNYEKEVAEGTELTLPTFTKENRTFKTWRNAVPADVASPVTVNANMTLTAVWNATVENVLYSWESPDGTVVETGGTAITKAQDGTTVDGNTNVNATLSNVAVAYKAIMLNGKISSNAWSGNYVQITTTEAIKTGDKVKVTACTTKGDTSKKGSAQMRAGTSATSTAIFTDGNSYNDIYADNTLSPNTKTFTVPDGVNTSTVTMTRSQSSTNCWVTKLQIIREVQVEEGDLLTVTFNSNGGSEVAAVQVASGQTVAKPADPTKAHNRFNEWQLSGSAYNFATPVTSNITLDADWTQLYTVTYAANGGSGEMTDANEYAAGDEVTLKENEFTYTGMEFVAWEVKETVSENAVAVNNGKFTMPAAAVTVKATWEVFVPGNNVIYNGNGYDGGTLPVDNNKYDAGVQVTVLGDPVLNDIPLTKTVQGETAAFHGWNTNSDMVSGTPYNAGDKFTMPDADVNLYAVWGFAINYNLDGGTINGTYPTWYVSDGATSTILTQLPTDVTREGYAFDGWYTENGNGNKITAINAGYYGNFEGDWALKAKWILTAPIGKAQSIDMEGLVESNGTGAEWQNYLYSHGYSFSTENVSLDEKKDPSENKAYDNWPYQGLKMKKSGAYVQGTVEADKLVIIKLGHMAADATVTIGGVAQEDATGLDAAEPAGQPNYYYVENESVLRYETTNDGACVLKAITITDPYTVSFAAHGDADPAALDGHPAVILPTPTNGTASFLGWFTAETGGTKIGDAGESYTPSADITLHAQWEAISTDARLSAIEITPNTGVLAPAFNMELTEYTYTMPYGSALPTITGATPNHEGATWYIESAATAWDETTIVRGKALSNDTKAYNITMLQGPKDGVEIISIAVKNGNGNAQTIAAEDISGFIGGTATQKLQSGSKKLGSNGNYIGFTLANSEELQAGDVIRLNVSATNGASHLTLYQDGSDANLVKDIEWTATEGINLIPIPSEAVGLSTLYIYRKSSVCNPTLSEFAILRPMAPVMTAITIDERAGEIDPLDDKHFNVTIPFEADLAALTVEPTVFWNGAHATTPGAVTSHEGAWVLQAEGDNTYRVMDKDGDYTDYTITLIRDIQKFTVSYNTHGGTAIEPELVVAGEKLAAAPADPTQEDYIFQGWSLTEDGAVIDITNVTIDEDKTFHAVWLYENPIKLIDNHAINNDDFITGVTLGNVTIGSEQVECFEFAGGLSDFINIKDKNRIVVYNATTNKTKIKVTMYNNKSSALTYYIKGVVEGSSDVVDIATVEVASGETKTSGYYEFNSDEAKNRSIYVYVETSASNMHFLQVKVIDNGETPVKKVGEIGYSLNLNKGRLFGRGSTEHDFEGIHFDNSSDYQPTSSTALKLANKSISFDVTEIVKMSVTTNNNKTYYVTRGAAGTSNETAKTGTTDFTLIPGKWFITAGSSNVEITNIAFSEATPDYTRENLNPAYLGTLCWTNDAVLTGGTLYEFAGKDEHNYLAFDEVEENLLVAGNPYIFMPENGNTEIKVYNINNVKLTEDQDPVNNMYGTITGKTLAQGADDNMYYFSANHIWAVKDFTVAIPIPAYCCYVDYPAVLAGEPAAAAAPGRRRVTMGVNGQNVATGMGEIEASETPMKVMINGQIFIIRGEKMFDATGRLVK